MANGSSNGVSILLGNGDGTFAAPVDYAVGSNPQSVAVGDFNADGKADIVTANNGSNSISILLNTSPSDLTPPTTTDDAPAAWQQGAVTVHLTPTDTGSGMSGGLAKTEYSRDGGRTWQVGTAVTYATWKRGGGSGLHTLLYRSTDAAGNLEEERSCEVKIDARPPQHDRTTRRSHLRPAASPSTSRLPTASPASPPAPASRRPRTPSTAAAG